MNSHKCHAPFVSVQLTRVPLGAPSLNPWAWNESHPCTLPGALEGFRTGSEV